ncbi:pyridine nucleotide-disulfide oxidoreductase domain-containing protein 2-like isoform X4 [Trifolium pratense]|uniref:pyridine nucleotide-disulfide oxidoreductase domain-containing protein 2-like isoform X4 n=1 Tax=Trifolium pratense TaxID=57577 RepID=UPI001E6928F7|nr:pyridine nucleotide-disulfide oxidoreductase domain-containing protein 2-like isoform X4 [Trifolium pratense]
MMWRRSLTTFSGNGGATAALRHKKWDAVVIGGGHNGLISAAYLARAGLSVAVLERRHLIGGAAVTEELIPGFKFSRCSYLLSLLRPQILRELELKRHGLKLLKPMASSFTPSLDGRYMLLGQSDGQDHSEISKFSKRDADAYFRYEAHLQKFSKVLDFVLDSPTPEILHEGASTVDLLRHKLQRSKFWAQCLGHTLSLGQKGMVDLMELLLSPTSKVLDKWFESNLLKGTLAGDAIIGSMMNINTPGSGYVLLHHVMGETDGDRNIWSCRTHWFLPNINIKLIVNMHVEGGMGAVSLAICKAAKEAGVHIETDTEVLLADGTEVHSSVVLSNATPYKTFMELVPQEFLPVEFLCAIKHSDYSSGTTKINVAVDKLPQFHCLKTNHAEVGPQHTATVHIGFESMENIISACQDAYNGIPSQRPVMEMTIPSSLDNTISPPGKHVISLFTQYTPYKPSNGSWDNAAYRESFAQRCFNLIEEYAPGFCSSVIGYDMLTPPDLEREIGLTGGNIFHGAMGLDSLFLMRPIKGWSNHKTPIQDLYLCGSGSHPGGGVMGAPGRNAACVVLQEFKNRYQ